MITETGVQYFCADHTPLLSERIAETYEWKGEDAAGAAEYRARLCSLIEKYGDGKMVDGAFGGEDLW